MQMLGGIAGGTPVWVWPLLVVLIGVGGMSMRQRVSPVWVYWMIPLFAVFALRAVAGIAPDAALWAVFAASYALGALIGWRVQPSWILRREGGRVHLRGEALTLLTILVVFAANFVVGTVAAVAPEVLGMAGFRIGFTLIEGSVSGVFLGRTLAIIGWRPA